MITEEMVHELNEAFRTAGSIIRFKFFDDEAKSCQIVPASSKYLDSCNLYLDAEGHDIVENYFRQHGVKLHWNNTHTIFW